MHGSNCNYCEYYLQQAGSGFALYKGLPHQRGYGFLNTLWHRIPISLKNYIGKTIFSLGKQLGEDIIVNKQNPKEALKRNLKSSAKTVAFDALAKAAEKVGQVGTGRKRRRRRANKKTATKKRKSANRRRAPARRRKTTRRRKSKKSSRIFKAKPIDDVFGY